MSVDRIATGLGLARAADALHVTVPLDARLRALARELGGTLAATLIR